MKLRKFTVSFLLAAFLLGCDQSGKGQASRSQIALKCSNAHGNICSGIGVPNHQLSAFVFGSGAKTASREVRNDEWPPRVLSRNGSSHGGTGGVGSFHLSPISTFQFQVSFQVSSRERLLKIIWTSCKRLYWILDFAKGPVKQKCSQNLPT